MIENNYFHLVFTHSMLAEKGGCSKGTVEQSVPSCTGNSMNHLGFSMQMATSAQNYNQNSLHAKINSTLIH